MRSRKPIAMWSITTKVKTNCFSNLQNLVQTCRHPHHLKVMIFLDCFILVGIKTSINAFIRILLSRQWAITTPCVGDFVQRRQRSSTAWWSYCIVTRIVQSRQRVSWDWKMCNGRRRITVQTLVHSLLCRAILTTCNHPHRSSLITNDKTCGGFDSFVIARPGADRFISVHRWQGNLGIIADILPKGYGGKNYGKVHEQLLQAMILSFQAKNKLM